MATKTDYVEQAAKNGIAEQVKYQEDIYTILPLTVQKYDWQISKRERYQLYHCIGLWDIMCITFYNQHEAVFRLLLYNDINMKGEIE